MTGVKVVGSGKHVLSEGEVLDYLKVKRNVGWVRAEELLSSVSDACVDGRADSLIVGNPGGDIVRLLEAIVAVNSVTGFVFKPLEIEKIFRWYLHTFGTFYMHTDTHAMKALAKALRQDDRIGLKVDSPDEMHEFIVNPPLEFTQRIRLINYLQDPEYIGCGHLKLLASYPDRYGVSIKVLRSLVTAFFDTMWAGTDEEKKLLVYPMLRGEHNERALLVVRVGGERLSNETLIPMIRPTDGKISMFVECPQARDYMAFQIAERIAEHYLVGRIGGVDSLELYRKIAELQHEGVRETVSILATGLPMYTVEVSQ